MLLRYRDTHTYIHTRTLTDVCTDIDLSFCMQLLQTSQEQPEGTQGPMQNPIVRKFTNEMALGGSMARKCVYMHICIYVCMYISPSRAQTPMSSRIGMHVCLHACLFADILALDSSHKWGLDGSSN